MPTAMRVEVTLAQGDSPPLAIGTLLSRGRQVYVEYAPPVLDGTVRLTPLTAPPSPGVHLLPTGLDNSLLGIFGDSLPDGWGLKVMHQRLTARGRDPWSLTATELLRLVGEGGPGALIYQPPDRDDEGPAVGSTLDDLATEAEALFEDRPEVVLRQLVAAAGRSGGVRPKVLIAVDERGVAWAGHTAPIPGTTEYLVKFPTQADGRQAGRIELAYTDLARRAGIVIPPTRAFVLGSGVTCFGVERFDRTAVGGRRHLASLAACLEADYRNGFLDYAQFHQVVYAATEGDLSAVEQSYRRMLFNILGRNQDDHLKNFAFLMRPSGEWQLAPAFDLTYSPITADRHLMSVAGHDHGIRREHAVATLDQVGGFAPQRLREIEEEVIEALGEWPTAAARYEVSPSRIREVERALTRLQHDFEGTPTSG